MNIVPDLPISAKINQGEIEQVQQEEHEYQLLGTFLRTRGLRLWGYNHFDDIIFEVSIQYGDTIHLVPFDGKLIPVDYKSEKCTVDSRFAYFESLNRQNAEKRVRNWKYGKIKELNNLVKPNPEGIKFY